MLNDKLSVCGEEYAKLWKFASDVQYISLTFFPNPPSSEWDMGKGIRQRLHGGLFSLLSGVRLTPPGLILQHTHYEFNTQCLTKCFTNERSGITGVW